MVKEDIFEGLKVALSKGESLKRAMMSLFNAGYPKEDIEEAARYLLQMQQSSNQPQPSQQVSTQPQYPPQAQPKKAQPVAKPVQQQPPQTPSKTQQPLKPPQKTAQKVSAYEEKPKSIGIVVTGVLILLLILLLGSLVAIFLFKDELAEFFGGIF